MKVLLDIGAYNGNTLKDALKFNYDIIHAFEPASTHHSRLWEIAQSVTKPSIMIHPVGLAGEWDMTNLYGAGNNGASMYREKPQGRNSKTEQVEIIGTSEWFSYNVREIDTIHVKINIEGAEIQVLNCLFQSGQIKKIDELCCYYDCVKVPGREYLMSMMERKFDRDNILPNRFMIDKQSIVKGNSIEKPYVLNWLRMINGKNND